MGGGGRKRKNQKKKSKSKIKVKSKNQSQKRKSKAKVVKVSESGEASQAVVVRVMEECERLVRELTPEQLADLVAGRAELALVPTAQKADLGFGWSR